MTTVDRTTNLSPNAVGPTAERVGHLILRYGLVVILLWIGLLKFTTYEAEGIKPLVANSPLLSWGYSAMSVEGFARLIGTAEIVFALLIALRPVSALATAVGSAGAVLMALTTLSFIVTTGPAWQPDHGVPFLSPMPGQFLLKDLLLLGVAVWSLGEAWTAHSARRPVGAARVTAVREDDRE